MSRLTEGSQIGRYRILRRLGAGAMGEVYLAEDPQIGRQLAIKTVRVEEGKPHEVEERKQRLLREARAAGKLLHPNIVTLFDAGEDQGLLYLAFEFIDGSDLDDRIANGPPLTLAAALAIVRQAAEGLDFAHRQGVIHRDIKPSNLMLTRDGRVKVADFGIAKLLDSTSDLTMSGSVVGSPHYLSPEQVRGDSLDGRTDIFSLGVMFYEMLCRQRPFDGQTLTTLVYQILHQEPTPIEARRSDLGPRVERLVRRMMHKDREQRFATAADVAAEIAACERELAPDLLARSIAMPAEMVGATVRLATDASTAVRPAAPPTTPGVPPLPVTATVAPPPPPPPPPATPPPAAGSPPIVAPAAPKGRLGLVLAAAAAVLVVLVAAGLGARRWAAGRDAADAAPVASPATERAAATPRESAAGTPRPPVATAATAAERPAESADATTAAAAPAAVASPAPGFDPGERERTGGGLPPVTTRSEPVTSPPAPAAPAPSTPRPATPPAPPASEPRAELAAASVPPAASEDAAPVEATAPPAADPRAVRDAIVARLPVAREMNTAMTLSFEIEPKEVAERMVVRLDRIVLGRAAEWNASKRGGRSYLVPEPGLHILSFLVDGAEVHRIRIDAQPGLVGPTRIHADLSQFGKRARRRPGGG